MLPVAGTLLIATPQLIDPNFQQTVVYLLESGPTGAMGLIINRPSTWSLAEIWPQAPAPIADRRVACEGGPVDHDRGMLLHDGDRFPGTQRLAPGLAIGGELDELLAAGARCRLFLGHAGWDAGQLVQEIRHGSWQVHPGSPGLVLNPTCDVSIWEELVRLPPPLEPPAPN